jgi:hypothetical protein
MSKTAEVDISNQINNSWSKDTVLAIVQDHLKYSVLVEVPNKSKIKQICNEVNTKQRKKKAKENKREKKNRKRYTNRVVSVTHAFLLYKILINNKNALEKVKVCKDTIPMYLDKYLQKIKNQMNTNRNLKHITIKYGLKKNNKAQKYAKDVASGDINPSYTLTRKDVEEIISFIKMFLTPP